MPLRRGGFMEKKALSSYTVFGRWSRKYSWWLVIGMLSTAAALVIIGVVLLIMDKPEQQERLFRIAKYLGAGGTALASLKAFWKEILGKYALIRLQQTTGHVVICGLGDKGKLLVDTFRAKGNRVVAIESKKDHPDIPGCTERGVLVLIGDASDAVVLDEANTARARFLFAVTGNDNTNIKITSQGRLLVEAVRTAGEVCNLRCYTHIASSSLQDIFSRHDLFVKTYDGFDASIFNIYETSARVVLEKYPPDFYARRQGQAGATLPVVLIGFGRMGEHIVKQAARIGQYVDWKQLEITVIDRGVKGSAEKFLAAYGDGHTSPSLIVPGIKLRFVERDPVSLSSLDELTGMSGSQPAVVYIALDNDSDGVSLALRVRTLLGSDAAPVVVCMRSALSELMKGHEAKFTVDRNIHGFNILESACGYQVLMEEVTDELARAIHNAYLDSLRNQPDAATNPSLVKWKDLPEDKKYSNRWQADHLSVKLRAIGCDGMDPAPLEHAAHDPSLLEAMSELEHRRWMAERLMSGWRYAAARDDARKLHPLLVPYEELSAGEKAKDDTMILNMKNLIASPGWKKQREFIYETGEKPTDGMH
jgi:voltage-gated potassium channel Kch